MFMDCSHEVYKSTYVTRGSYLVAPAFELLKVATAPDMRFRGLGFRVEEPFNPKPYTQEFR